MMQRVASARVFVAFLILVCLGIYWVRLGVVGFAPSSALSAPPDVARLVLLLCFGTGGLALVGGAAARLVEAQKSRTTAPPPTTCGGLQEVALATNLRREVWFLCGAMATLALILSWLLWRLVIAPGTAPRTFLWIPLVVLAVVLLSVAWATFRLSARARRSSTVRLFVERAPVVGGPFSLLVYCEAPQALTPIQLHVSLVACEGRGLLASVRPSQGHRPTRMQKSNALDASTTRWTLWLPPNAPPTCFGMFRSTSWHVQVAEVLNNKPFGIAMSKEILVAQPDANNPK